MGLLRRTSSSLQENLQRFRSDLFSELDWDVETDADKKQVNNFGATGPLTDEYDSSENEDSEGQEDEDEYSEADPVKSKGSNCCLFCSCLECIPFCRMPVKPFDAVYYRLQSCIEHCPTGCPTCIPKQHEEEWRFPQLFGQRYAMCYCCTRPGGIILIKYLDCILCPLCVIWDTVKGADYGYRRFRVQARIHRHYESESVPNTWCHPIIKRTTPSTPTNTVNVPVKTSSSGPELISFVSNEITARSTCSKTTNSHPRWKEALRHRYDLTSLFWLA
ncbi:unnamed protein product [Schistocephalus solidus]|uniref:Cysteine-rich DPF motif domain-containing protein 1 n=1 Tax=Schistocephalus solidus TaxID=70667 RepID=A0A183T701_SCHSO|nr:unnamed protein product [Schistocephalus solidus]